jgi:hypothetical protein
LEPEVNDEEIERTDRQEDTAAVKPLRAELSLESRIRASIMRIANYYFVTAILGVSYSCCLADPATV